MNRWNELQNLVSYNVELRNRLFRNSGTYISVFVWTIGIIFTKYNIIYNQKKVLSIMVFFLRWSWSNEMVIGVRNRWDYHQSTRTFIWTSCQTRMKLEEQIAIKIPFINPKKMNSVCHIWSSIINSTNYYVII